MLAHIFHAQLEGAAEPWLQRRLKPIRERPADVLRADQIEFGRLGPRARRKVDRIEIGFLQGQASTFEVEAL